MSGLFRFVTFVAVALWSLVLWGAYAIVSFGGDLLYRNADQVSDSAETVEWVAWLLSLTQGIGLVAILVVWGLGVLLIGGIGLALARLFRNREPLRYEPVRPAHSGGPAEPEILPPPARPSPADDRPRGSLPPRP